MRCAGGGGARVVGAEVVAHDPYVRDPDWRRALGDGASVPLTGDLWQALDGADCAALVTRHRAYEALDLRRLKSAMDGSALVDGRNVFDLSVCAQIGLVARVVGNGKRASQSAGETGCVQETQGGSDLDLATFVGAAER